MITLMAAAVLVAGAAAPTVDEFFAEFAKKREHIQTLQAEFVQDNVSQDETMRSGGRIAFAKPKQLLFEYRDPAIVYAIDGNRVFEYEADLKQVQIYDIEDSAQADAFFIAFDNDASRLREAYDVTLEDGRPGDCGQRVLTLLPKKSEDENAESNALFREIRLYLRAEDLLPCRIRALNEEGTEVIITISAYAINDATATIGTQFTVPEGTMIVENEDKFDTVGPGGKLLPEKPAAPPTPAEK